MGSALVLLVCGLVLFTAGWFSAESARHATAVPRSAERFGADSLAQWKRQGRHAGIALKVFGVVTFVAGVVVGVASAV